MKKILLTSFALAVIGFTAKVQAQCAIAQTSILVNIKSIVANGGGGCTTVFDLTYDIANNGGNKWSYVHLWDANAYPAIVYGNGTGPNHTTLNGGAGSPDPLLTTVALDYISGTPTISSSYGPDAAIIPQTTGGISVTRTTVGALQRFFIQNISVASANCNPLNLKADVWSAQDNNGKIVGCAVTGLEVRADEPQMVGLIQCVNPRTYGVSFKTNTTRTITWNVYKDVAPFGVFDPNDLANLVDGPRVVSNPGDATFHYNGNFALPGGAGSLYNIWIVATAVGISNSNAIFVVNTCASLPVDFRSFTATRSHSNVMLKWETASEHNNSGFAVERNANGSWEQIAYVSSQATNGNSDATLDYQYIDLNNSKGITQYRIKEVDFDNKSTYSDTRMVRGDDQIGKIIIFPNPSFNGKVSVSFEDASVSRDVLLIDMSGRVLKEWKFLTNNSITIDNLTPGMYTLKTVVIETGEQVTEKFVVNKR